MHEHRPLPIPTPAPPAEPTARLVVGGIELAPAERLLALASIRDNHRARARGANDRQHELRERVEENQRRIRLIGQRIEPGRDARADAEIAEIEAENAQLRAARDATLAEADEAGQAAGAADRLLKAAAQFARDQGAVLPATVAAELRERENARVLPAKL